MVEFLTRKTPNAKKKHICDLCGGEIDVGEKYERQSGMVDGEFYEMKSHSSCMEICRRYCRDTGESEFVTECVIDWLRDRICDDCKAKEECQHITPFTCTKIYELTRIRRVDNG